MKKLALLVFLFLPGKLHAYGRFYNPETPQKTQGDFNDVFDELTKVETAVNTSSPTYALKSHLPINVKDAPFNAKGDDSTDDTAAFNLAIASAAANAEFGQTSIFIPHGTYRVCATVGDANISFFGEDEGTVLRSTSPTATCFSLNYTGTAVRDRRYVRDIYFFGYSRKGRGIYMNAPGFLSIQNCQFQSLEYGRYFNSSEWIDNIDNHTVSCTYGYIATAKNNDVLGNNPQISQNSAAHFFLHDEYFSDMIDVYGDDPDNAIGDHQPAFFFDQCKFLTSTMAVAAVYPRGSTIYYMMTLNNCWFEANGGNFSDTVTFNGNVLKLGDIYMSGGQVSIDHANINGRLSLTNSAKLVGNDIHFNDSALPFISTDSLAYVNNLQMDYQNGRSFDWAYADNLQLVNADRPALARTHSHLGFTNGGAFKNVLSGVTSTCYKGTLPGVASGAPTVTFDSSDGFFSQTSVKIVGKTGDSMRWAAAVSSANWYVTTFAVRTTTAVTTQTSTFTISNNTNIIVPTGIPITVSPTWRTYGGIGSPAGSGAIGLDVTLQTATTLYFSLFQVVEFPSLQEAKDFYNSDTFVIPQGEVGIYPSTTTGSGGTGTVTSVGSGTGLTGGPITTSGTLLLADTAVTPASYTNTNLTVDQQGRITAASNGTSSSGGYALQPATVTIQAGKGLTTTTETISGLSPGVMHVVINSSNVVTALVSMSTETIGAFISSANVSSALTITPNGTNNSAITVGINFSSVASQNDLNAYMTQSSSTLNDLKLSSAVATYFQIASSMTLSNTFLLNSSATANYLSLSSASATYFNKNSVYVGSLTVTNALILAGTNNASNAAPILGVNSSSVAVLSSGLIPNLEIDGSSITKQGLLVAGSNITLTPGTGILTIAASASGGSGTSVYNATATAGFPFGFSSSTGAFSGNVAVGTTSLVSLTGAGRSVTLSAGSTGDVNAAYEIQGSRTGSNVPFGNITGYNQTNRVTDIRFLQNAANDDGYIDFRTKPSGGSETTALTLNTDQSATFASSITTPGFIGVGTTTPLSGLHINGLGGITISSGSLAFTVQYSTTVLGALISTNTQINGALTVVSASTQPCLLNNGLIVTGRIVTSTAAPTISSCGSTPNGSVVGNDIDGKITIGGGVVTSCTMTFGGPPWANPPSCPFVSNVAITNQTGATTTTTFTLGAGATFAGDIIMYHCSGYQ